jgi:hypothetical protein
MAYRTFLPLRWTVLALLAAVATGPACRRETAGLGLAVVRPDAAVDAASDGPSPDRVMVEPSDGPIEVADADAAAAEAAVPETGAPDLGCKPGAARCAGPFIERCNAEGVFKTNEMCPAACWNGVCMACVPESRRCTASGGLEECKKDGSGFVAGAACPDGCQAGKCNVCAPNATTCSGTTQRTCRADGTGWDESTCTPPVGGTAGCNGNRCDITCPAGRTKMGDRCVCAGATVECGGACVPATETIEIADIEKKCALPISDICDPFTYQITVQGCAKHATVVVHASPDHCAPIHIQMSANGTPRGARSAAIPPNGFSETLDVGAIGPGPVTLGFAATVARSGCGVGGLVSGWGGSAKVTLTVR